MLPGLDGGKFPRRRGYHNFDFFWRDIPSKLNKMENTQVPPPKNGNLS